MNSYDARLATMTDDELAAECLRAVRLALSGSRSVNGPADRCWFAAVERGRVDLWDAAVTQARAERREMARGGPHA